MTTGQLLMATRGQWKRAEGGKVICPVDNCGKEVLWMDWARMAHLKVHTRPKPNLEPGPVSA